jgi:hypothetical protein
MVFFRGIVDMIHVEFVESSRSQLRMVFSEPADRPAADALPFAACMLFSALQGKLPVPAPTAAPDVGAGSSEPYLTNVYSPLAATRRMSSPLFAILGVERAVAA